MHENASKTSNILTKNIDKFICSTKLIVPRNGTNERKTTNIENIYKW